MGSGSMQDDDLDIELQHVGSVFVCWSIFFPLLLLPCKPLLRLPYLFQKVLPKLFKTAIVPYKIGASSLFRNTMANGA